MKVVSVEEFQKDWDNYISKVENGETFIISNGTSQVYIVPYDKYDETTNAMSDLEKCYRFHDEGS